MSAVTFDRLIAPMERQDLLDEYFEQKPHLFEESRELGLGLDFAALDQLLWAVFGSDRKLVEIQTANGPVLRPSVQGARLDQFYAGFGKGHALRVTEVETIWGRAARLVADTAKALSAEVTAAVCALPAGFPTDPVIQWEEHESFILQLEGQSSWQLYEPSYPLPTDRGEYRSTLHPMVSRAVDEGKAKEQVAAELAEGQCLYIPRGTYRRRRQMGNASMYLELVIRPMTWAELGKAALDAKSLEEPNLRASLPIGFVSDPEIRGEIPGDYGTKGGSEPTDENVQRAVSAMYKWLNWQRSIVPDGHFAEVTELDTLELDTELERRIGLDVVVAEPSGGQSRLVFAGTRIDGPEKIQDALSFVASHERFKVRDIPLPTGMDDDSKVVLARKLLVKGLVRRTGESNKRVASEQVLNP